MHRRSYKPKGHGLTPSAAYEQAYQRGGAHDEMQFGLMRWLSRLRDSDPEDDLLSDVGPFVHKRADQNAWLAEWIIPEFPLSAQGGGLLGFVDIALLFETSGREHGAPGGYRRARRCYRLLELKPRIDSVGGLIRQIRVLERRAAVALKSSSPWVTDTEDIEVVAVVYNHDPNLHRLEWMLGGHRVRAISSDLIGLELAMAAGDWPSEDAA